MKTSMMTSSPFSASRRPINFDLFVKDRGVQRDAARLGCPEFNPQAAGLEGWALPGGFPVAFIDFENRRFWLCLPGPGGGGSNHKRDAAGYQCVDGAAFNRDAVQAGIDPDAAGLPENRLFFYQVGVFFIHQDFSFDPVAGGLQIEIGYFPDFELLVDDRGADAE